MENAQKRYPKWVGVVLGFVLSGSAHFLSGRRGAGVAWLAATEVCGIAGCLTLAVPGTGAWVAGLALVMGGLVLWCVMLVRSYRVVPRIGWLGWVGVVAVAAVLNATGHRSIRWVVRPFRVPTEAMSPTIQAGDRILMEKLSYRFREPRRGEVVVFRTTGIPNMEGKPLFVKRVVGLPGERVRVVPPNILVNGRLVKSPGVLARISSAEGGYGGYTLAEKTWGYAGALVESSDEVVLGEGEYFVAGDNSVMSNDSRYWGAVRRENIIGRASRIWWAPGRVGESLGTE